MNVRTPVIVPVCGALDVPGPGALDVPGEARIWAKVPGSIIRDTSLSASARLVYCELALWAGKGKTRVSRGVRPIASALGIDRRTVMDALDELANAKHVEVSGAGRSRRSYRLTSPVHRGQSIKGESAGEVVEFYDVDGVLHRRMTQARTENPAARPRSRKSA